MARRIRTRTAQRKINDRELTKQLNRLYLLCFNTLKESDQPMVDMEVYRRPRARWKRWMRQLRYHRAYAYPKRIPAKSFMVQGLHFGGGPGNMEGILYSMDGSRIYIAAKRPGEEYYEEYSLWRYLTLITKPRRTATQGALFEVKRFEWHVAQLLPEGHPRRFNLAYPTLAQVTDTIPVVS